MKYNGHTITTIWLDLDDTIIDFTTNAQRALQRMWHEEPILQRLFADPDIWAESYEAHNQMLWAAYSEAKITRDFLRLDRFYYPLSQAGLSHNQAIDLAKRYDTLYLDHLAEERQLIPGAIDLLKSLRQQSITIGILSNGFKDVQFRKITNAGLDPFIDIVVLSDDISINKPDIRLYQYAMQQAGDTTPLHHLMIGDNCDTDIAGAINAGWHAIWFNRHNALTTTPPPIPAATALSQITNMLLLK